MLYGGQPAPLARITFHPMGGPAPLQKLRPTAQADEEGRFQIRTFGLRDGAPEGKYKVTVVWHGPDPDTDLQSLNTDQLSYGPNRLPERFAHAETTPLEATITSGKNRLAPFHVD